MIVMLTLLRLLLIVLTSTVWNTELTWTRVTAEGSFDVPRTPEASPLTEFVTTAAESIVMDSTESKQIAASSNYNDDDGGSFKSRVLQTAAATAPTSSGLRSYQQMGYECRCLIESKSLKGLFLAAQREIFGSAMDKQQKPTMKRFKFLDYFYDRFFRSDQGADVFLVRGAVLANVLMYKVNSEGIFFSLQHAEAPVRAPHIDLAAEWDRKKEIFTVPSPAELQARVQNITSHRPVYGEGEGVAAVGTSGDGGAAGRPGAATAAAVAAREAVIFAFVRDPLQHYVSGMVEAHFRNLGFGAHPTDERTADYQRALLQHRANASTARQAIEAVARGDRVGMEQLLREREHFFPMTYALLKWRPAFVGHLETFEEDWALLQDFAGITNRSSSGGGGGSGSAGMKDAASVTGIPLERPLGHPTQHDILGMKSALQSLFATDGRYLRAVCWLLLVDFHCLKYTLPQPCADIVTDSRWKQMLTRCKR